MTMHLVQINHAEHGRRVAAVDDRRLLPLKESRTIYHLAQSALDNGIPLSDAGQSEIDEESAIDYDAVYEGNGEWRLLPCFDHPTEPSRCHVSGTGLTHKGSAINREAMHEETAADVTDSMCMFQWGLEGGNPAPGDIGVQPEWFYKGYGSILRGHAELLNVPDFAEDGGEEPEIVGLYLIDMDGRPRRVGMSTGNEFADHVMEKRNYLYLAPSKLRQCAIGPELIVDPPFDDIRGTVKIERQGSTVWSQAVATGEANMCHSLANIEYHQFKYSAHRRPGDVHLHFYGADAFSFGAGLALQDGDVMVVQWDGFGRALWNPLRMDRREPDYGEVQPV